MRGRIFFSACIVLLMSGTAYAVDEEQACMDRLAAAETLVDQRVEAKALSEGEVEEVNMLLDEADEACTEGQYKKANETLANVTKLVTPQADAPQAGTPQAQE